MDLIIQTTPAVIDTNYDQIHAQVSAEVTKYGDVVVTSDTLAAAKKSATHLNKLKAEIAKRRKEAVSLASAPVREFEEKVKDLEAMCEEGRQRIKSQVEQFEKVTLDAIRNALADYMVECYEDGRVTIEFQSARIDDLVKLTAFTTTGKLAKASREAVESRVMACQNKMATTNLRISELENESYRSGLHSPLSREHIAGFLFEEDHERYSFLLDNLIAKELDRQKATIEAAEKARLAELAAKQNPIMDKLNEVLDETFPEDRAPLTKQAQIEEQIRPSAPPAQEPLPMTAPTVELPAGATRVVHVAVSLKLNAPVGASLTQIEYATQKKLNDAGVEKSVLSIFATEVAQQGAA